MKRNIRKTGSVFLTSVLMAAVVGTTGCSAVNESAEKILNSIVANSKLTSTETEVEMHSEVEIMSENSHSEENDEYSQAEIISENNSEMESSELVITDKSILYTGATSGPISVDESGKMLSTELRNEDEIGCGDCFLIYGNQEVEIPGGECPYIECVIKYDDKKTYIICSVGLGGDEGSTHLYKLEDGQLSYCDGIYGELDSDITDAENIEMCRNDIPLLGGYYSKSIVRIENDSFCEKSNVRVAEYQDDSLDYILLKDCVFDCENGKKELMAHCVLQYEEVDMKNNIMYFNFNGEKVFIEFSTVDGWPFHNIKGENIYNYFEKMDY